MLVCTLTEENKDILRKRFINQYSLKIKYNNLEIKDYIDDIEQIIDDTIDYCIKNNPDGVYRELANKFKIYSKKHKLIHYTEKKLYEKALEDNFFKNIFTEYYINRIINNAMLNCNTTNNEIIAKLEEFIRNEIEKHISSKKNYIVFGHSISHSLYAKKTELGLKTNRSLEKNRVINAASGNIEEKNKLKEKYLKDYISKLSMYDTKLTDEELKEYFEVCIPNFIDDYFNNNCTSCLRVYVNTKFNFNINLLKDDYALIKYARKVTSNLPRVIKHYEDLFQYLIDKYDDDTIKNEYRRLVKHYVLYSNFCIPIKDYISNNLNKYAKRRKSHNYDMEKIKQGNINELENMHQQLKYIIDDYYNRYQYCDTRDNAYWIIEDYYLKDVDLYLSASMERSIISYLHTRLNQQTTRYLEESYDNNILKYLVIVLCDYTYVMDSYLDNNDLSHTEKGNLYEYMDNIFEDYFVKGKYVDNKEYFENELDYYIKNLKV